MKPQHPVLCAALALLLSASALAQTMKAADVHPAGYPTVVAVESMGKKLDAATQGLGVALESAVNAGGHLADGKLKPVFGMDRAIRVKAHFAVYPERHAKRPAVEAFLAWLHAEAART